MSKTILCKFTMFCGPIYYSLVFLYVGIHHMMTGNKTKPKTACYISNWWHLNSILHQNRQAKGPALYPVKFEAGWGLARGKQKHFALPCRKSQQPQWGSVLPDEVVQTVQPRTVPTFTGMGSQSSISARSWPFLLLSGDPQSHTPLALSTPPNISLLPHPCLP